MQERETRRRTHGKEQGQDLAGPCSQWPWHLGSTLGLLGLRRELPGDQLELPSQTQALREEQGAAAN